LKLLFLLTVKSTADELKLISLANSAREQRFLVSRWRIDLVKLASPHLQVERRNLTAPLTGCSTPSPLPESAGRTIDDSPQRKATGYV
jgi:hypothetical protein